MAFISGVQERRAPVKSSSLIGRDQQMDNSLITYKFTNESYTNDSKYENESSICWSRPIKDELLTRVTYEKILNKHYFLTKIFGSSAYSVPIDFFFLKKVDVIIMAQFRFLPTDDKSAPIWRQFDKTKRRARPFWRQICKKYAKGLRA